MRIATALLFAILASHAASAYDSPLASTDESLEVGVNCGKPLNTVTTLDDHSREIRTMRYPAARVIFSKQSGLWTLTMGTTKDGGVLTPDELGQKLPCVAKLARLAKNAADRESFGGEFVQTDANPIPIPRVIAAIAVDVLLPLALLGAVALFAYWAYRRWSRWVYCPRRLCTSCYFTAQPLQHKDGCWYCGHCGVENPVPLDSPLARAIYEQQAQASRASQL